MSINQVALSPVSLKDKLPCPVCAAEQLGQDKKSCPAPVSVLHEMRIKFRINENFLLIKLDMKRI
jgi:hypothetical protein